MNEPVLAARGIVKRYRSGERILSGNNMISRCA